MTMDNGLYTYPQVQVRKKGRYGAYEEDIAFKYAIETARGSPRVLPVVWNGKHLGWVRGVHAFSPSVYYTRRTDIPREALTNAEIRAREKAIAREIRKLQPFTSYDDAISKVFAATPKYYDKLWSLAHTTAPGGGSALQWYDCWPVEGTRNGVGGYTGTAYTALQVNDGIVGALSHGGNVSTATKHIAVMSAMASAGTPSLLVYDRVLVYDGCSWNASVNQAMTNGVAAQRYIATGEEGLLIANCCQTASGATAWNLTQLQYTDDEGNGTQSMPTTRTITGIVSLAAPTATLGARVQCPATAAGTGPWGPWLPLAAGDCGARLIANFTTSAANTGTMCFSMHALLGIIPTYIATATTMYDSFLQILQLSRVYDGAAISFMAWFPASTAATFQGHIRFVWG